MKMLFKIVSEAILESRKIIPYFPPRNACKTRSWIQMYDKGENMLGRYAMEIVIYDMEW